MQTQFRGKGRVDDTLHVICFMYSFIYECNTRECDVKSHKYTGAQSTITHFCKIMFFLFSNTVSAVVIR